MMTNTYDPAAFVTSQTLEGRRGSGPPFRVNLRNELSKDDDEIFGFVSGWLCHRGRRAVFVELLYACNKYLKAAAIDRYCGGEMSEWERYISLDGRLLDSGYTIEDPRYRELNRRLGLSDSTAEQLLQAD